MIMKIAKIWDRSLNIRRTLLRIFYYLLVSLVVGCPFIDSLFIGFKNDHLILPFGEEIDLFNELVVLPSDFNLERSAVAWSSDDENVVTVTQDGLAGGISPGTTDVTAVTSVNAMTIRAGVVIEVPIPDIDAVRIEPSDVIMEVGGSVQLSAYALLGSYMEIDITADADWSSSDSSVDIDAQGRASATSLGDAIITAAYQQVSAVLQISVGTQKNVTVEPWPGRMRSNTGEYAIAASSSPSVSWGFSELSGVDSVDIEVFFQEYNDWSYSAWKITGISAATTECVYGIAPGGTVQQPALPLQHNGVYTFAIIAYSASYELIGLGYILLYVNDGVQY